MVRFSQITIKMFAHVCCYLHHLNLWASVAQYEPAKRRSDDSEPTAYSMIKSTKDKEEEEESTRSWNCLHSPRGDLPNL